MQSLAGKKGLIIGIANRHSIASGCAQAFHEAGAELVITYLNDKALPFVSPVAEALGTKRLLPLNLQSDEQLDAVFSEIENTWGALDFVLHSVAYCPQQDLHARVTDCSREGFAEAMDISCHSFIRTAKRAAPLMKSGGTLLTVSYYGAEKVVDNYNIMGPVKAALESSVRYLAADLGPQGIRVNALSPGPLKTRAASGINHFDQLIDEATRRAPERRLVTIEEVGALAAHLVSDASRGITGNVSYIDAGYNIMA